MLFRASFSRRLATRLFDEKILQFLSLFQGGRKPSRLSAAPRPGFPARTTVFRRHLATLHRARSAAGACQAQIRDRPAAPGVGCKPRKLLFQITTFFRKALIYVVAKRQQLVDVQAFDINTGHIGLHESGRVLYYMSAQQFTQSEMIGQGCIFEKVPVKIFFVKIRNFSISSIAALRPFLLTRLTLGLILSEVRGKRNKRILGRH